MEISLVIAGFGGQGVLFAGKLLAHAGMAYGKNVTWFPSYGPEMRGGTANCTVILSDHQIGAPMVSQPNIVLAMNMPSFEKYQPAVRPDGLLVLNSSVIDRQPEREDIQWVSVAANHIAEQEGNSKMMNMAMVGAMLAKRHIMPMETVENALKEELAADQKEALLAGNMRVLHAGFESVQIITT